MRSVLLILLFVLPVLSRQASADDPKVRLQQAFFLREPKQLDLVEFKSEVSLELEDLIEGLAVVVPIRVKNGSGKNLRDLSSKISCACLRVDSLEGRDLANGDLLEFKLTILPTSDRYSQKLLVSAAPDAGERQAVLGLNLSGKVRKPVVLSRVAATMRELANDPVRMKVKSETGIELDFAKVSVFGEGLKIRGLKNESEIELSSNGDVKQGAVLLTLPFKWKGNDFTHTQVFELVDETFQIAPSRLYFRRSGDKYMSKAVIKTRGSRLNIGEFNFKLVGFPEKREKTIRAISAKTRELSSESCYVELSIEVSAVSEIEVNQPLVEIVYDIKSAARSVGCVFEEFP